MNKDQLRRDKNNNLYVIKDDKVHRIKEEQNLYDLKTDEEGNLYFVDNRGKIQLYSLPVLRRRFGLPSDGKLQAIAMIIAAFIGVIFIAKEPIQNFICSPNNSDNSTIFCDNSRVTTTPTANSVTSEATETLKPQPTYTLTTLPSPVYTSVTTQPTVWHTPSFPNVCNGISVIEIDDLISKVTYSDDPEKVVQSLLDLLDDYYNDAPYKGEGWLTESDVDYIHGPAIFWTRFEKYTGPNYLTYGVEKILANGGWGVFHVPAGITYEVQRPNGGGRYLNITNDCALEITPQGTSIPIPTNVPLITGLTSELLNLQFGEGNWFCFPDILNAVGVRNLPLNFIPEAPIYEVHLESNTYPRSSNPINDGGKATAWFSTRLASYDECPANQQTAIAQWQNDLRNLDLTTELINSILGQGNWTCGRGSDVSVQTLQNDILLSYPFISADRNDTKYAIGETVPKVGEATFWLQSGATCSTDVK